MLPTFGSLIRGRLKALRMSQRDLGAALSLTHETINRILTEKQGVPIERGDEWADALAYAGEERNLFLDLMHLAAASPRVRELYTREREARLTAEMFKKECQHRIRRARQVLDLMDPTGSGTLPPALERLVDDDMAAARAVDDATRVADGGAPALDPSQGDAEPPIDDGEEPSTTDG